jgi:hypothetical protein
MKGRIKEIYNQPLKMKVSLLAGGAFEITGLEGGVFLPVTFADLHFRPSKWASIHCGVVNQHQFGWQYQKISDTRSLEVGARIFLRRNTIDKSKEFTVGEFDWNVDFQHPVKVLWNLGISGNYRQGRGAFNSGQDPNTSIRFKNKFNDEIGFLNQVAVPYSFKEFAVGFVLNTSSAMKLKATLPGNIIRTRRMHTFTEFRAELVYGTPVKYDTSVYVKPSEDATKYQEYSVMILKTHNFGYRITGFFRRKLIGLKIEAGMRPGVEYHFSGRTENSFLNRSYLQVGFGFGWM